MSAILSLRLTHESLHDILPVSQGGSGKQKALALLGDRLLDLKLYQELILGGEEREGWMTQKRSMMVSNDNLGKCGMGMLVPNILSRNDYAALSKHEQGTMVEAYLGALYMQEACKITDALDGVIKDVLARLKAILMSDPAAAQQPKVLSRSQYKPPPDRKKAKSTLLEIMQKRGVDKAATFFSTKSVSTTPNLPPFVSKFEPNFDLIHCGLPDPGPMVGEPCSSKKEAEENVASKVLAFFRDREMQVFAPVLLSREEKAQGGSTATTEDATVSAVVPTAEPVLAPDPPCALSNVVTTAPIAGDNVQPLPSDVADTIVLKHSQCDPAVAAASITVGGKRGVPSMSEPLPKPAGDTVDGEVERSGKKRRSGAVLISLQTDRDKEEGEEEEGEIAQEDMQERLRREREEENRRVRENLIAVRKARAEAEKKKIQNFRKYAVHCKRR